MNEVRRRGPIARAIVGIWDAMNFTRRLVFNVLFFGLLIFLLMLMFSGGGLRPLDNRTTLVIAPEGKLVEQYSSDLASRALARVMGDREGEEVQLRDLLRALEAARTDKRIERVYVRFDRLEPSGYASLREVAAALANVRAAGKQVVAFGDYYQQEQYLLASQANEVYLDPMGGLVLEGLDRYRQFYREGLQDKLGVDVHLFKVGEFKSAAEPYVLDAASPQAKEADLFWMNDVWQRFLADIAKARDLSAQKLAAGIDTLPESIAAARGDLARHALQQKLVDGLKTEEEVDHLLIERGVADPDAEGGFRQVSFDTYLTHIDNGLQKVDPRPQVAVVVAEGEITGGEQPPGTIGGESTAALLREARDDDNVKTVVLRVDSPGGEVFASEQIRREVVALKAAGKPVVVSMGDLAASGGYWISMDADRIYADPSTITGSIGIFGVIPTIPRALEKIGVRTDGVGTTRFAGAFDITRDLDPAVGDIIQSVIEKGYRDFTTRVAKARKRPVDDIDAVARGRVWTGAQARERGLVDAFGGLQAAIDDAATRAKLGKADAYRVRYIEKEATAFERFFAGFVSSRAGSAWMHDSSFAQGVARAVLARNLPQVDADLRFLDSALQKRPGSPVKALAYCFCEF
ncbi:signal peptide peptidase SppA [Lysobacter sp. A6]|uniref:Signal peptide peptidase SppA n=1 Tax=Noviluteimonas lactosilytica TaxID=2888523 RepID=A0ABS8JHB4_9GAMM|nr:signal peptide peptidase SppA [Lysobacter lactosilyticus]MCC8362949.1 signal peptide peptidase SppA [Lysobacter lactosilyticus]